MSAMTKTQQDALARGDWENVPPCNAGVRYPGRATRKPDATRSFPMQMPRETGWVRPAAYNAA